MKFALLLLLCASAYSAQPAHSLNTKECPVRGWKIQVGDTFFPWPDDFIFDIYTVFMPSDLDPAAKDLKGAVHWVEVPANIVVSQEVLWRVGGKSVERYIYRPKDTEGLFNRMTTLLLLYDRRPFFISQPEFFETFVHTPPKQSPYLVVTESLSGTGAFRTHHCYRFADGVPHRIKTLSGSRSAPNADAELYK